MRLRVRVCVRLRVRACVRARAYCRLGRMVRVHIWHSVFPGYECAPSRTKVTRNWLHPGRTRGVSTASTHHAGAVRGCDGLPLYVKPHFWHKATIEGDRTVRE